MFNLDLKKAETALEAGRLDEAYSMLTSTPRRFHAEGQRLIDRLVTALLQRGNDHYQQQRFPAARSDASLAQKIGGPQIEIANLLQQVDARDHSFVQKSIAETQEELVAQLNHLIQQQRFDQALTLLAKIPQSTQNAAEIQQLKCELGCAVRSKINSDIKIGRLERANAVLTTMHHAGFEDSQTIQLGNVLKKFNDIVNDVRDARYVHASRKLKLQKQVIPDAVWIDDAIEAAEKCQAATEQILSGPLGFVVSETGSDQRKSMKPSEKRNAEQNAQAIANSEVKTPVADGFQTLLHVDQLGSLLILTSPRITVGTTSSVRHNSGSDIVLQTEGGDSIEITRSGGDYLAESRSNFVVNDRSSNQHLLSNGDTIHVGKRGRLKFLQSVAASDSAVLKISGSKMKQRQIRSIVLLGESLVFGASSGHFRVPGLRHRVILSPQAASGSFLIHQQGSTDRFELTPAATATFDGCRFTSQRSVT